MFVALPGGRPRATARPSRPATLVRLRRLAPLLPLGVGALVGCRDAAAEAYRDAPRLELTPGVRYCEDETPEHCQLLRVSAIAMDPAGGVVLGEPRGPLARFDAAGRHVTDLARRAGYRDVAGAHALADGRVVLYDLGAGLRVLHDSAGRVRRRIADALPPATREVQSGPFGIAVLRETDATGAAVAGDSVDAVIELRADTLPPRVIATLRVPRAGRPAGGPRLHPFLGDPPRWTVEGDSSALVASGPTLRVERLTSDGGRRLLVASAAVGSDSSGADTGDTAAPRAPAAFAAALVPVRGGGFWLREARRLPGDSARWTRFAPDGAPLGQTRLPADAALVAALPDRALVVRYDARGVPVVVWHRVARAPVPAP